MSACFTKAVRQDIVREFALRHNGQYDPVLFLKEVQETGKGHPAYKWFEWDAAKAAHEFNLEQARAFARDLRVTFSVEEVRRNEPVSVRQVSMPLVQSPLEGRKKGGGYVLVDPENGEHKAEHCRQAASALRSWLNRYGAAVVHAGMTYTEIEEIASKLDKAASGAAAA